MTRLAAFALLVSLSALSGARADTCIAPGDDELRRIVGADQEFDYIQEIGDAMGCRIEAYLFAGVPQAKNEQGKRARCIVSGRRHFISLSDTGFQDDGSVDFSAISRGNVNDEAVCSGLSFPVDYVFLSKGISPEVGADVLEGAELIRSRIGLAAPQSNSMESIVSAGRLIEISTGTETYPWSAMYCQERCVVVKYRPVVDDDAGGFQLIEILP